LDNIKKVLLLLLLASSFSFGCEIKWQNSLDAAKKASAKTKKPILVFVSSPTCPYCTIMSETTFEDEGVCELVNSKFVPMIALDGSADMPKNSKVRGVPTVVFVDSGENEVAQKVVGLRNKNDFLNDLKLRFQR